MNIIEKFISEKNYSEAIQECIRTNHNNLGILLSHAVGQFGSLTPSAVGQFGSKTPSAVGKEKIVIQDDQRVVRVKILCHWASSDKIREWWNKMSKGNYTWNNIQIVLDDDPDYFVVINAPPSGENPDPSKTIIFRMEPYMGTKNKEHWGKWANPDPDKFFRICFHKTDYNNNCWEISKTYQELKTMTINKTEYVLSTV